VGHGKPQELVGIDRSVIDADFVMQMWTGAAAAQSDIPDSVTAADVLSGDNGIAGKVSIAGGYSMAVVKGDRPSVSAQEIREHYHAIGRSYHRLPV
jgi:hypothetical protein